MGSRDVIGYSRLFEWGKAALSGATSNAFIAQPLSPPYSQDRNAHPLATLASSSPADRPCVTCIMPAYNEGGRIAAVLSVVANHPLVDEVIVIDDGSTDDTANEAALFDSVRVIVSERNHGKSGAVIEGLKVARGTILLLLDADLRGLTRENLTDLILPVTSGIADVAISLRGNALWPWKLIGLDFVSGERVFSRGLIAKHEDEIARLPGFGLEVFMNNLMLAEDCTLAIVKWENVLNLQKTVKYGIWYGMIGEIRMLRQIAKTVTLVGTVSQIYALLLHANRDTAKADARSVAH